VNDPTWPVRESVVEYQNPWFDAGHDVVRQPDGERGDYYWIETDYDDVTIVAVTDDAEVVLVEQYRPRLRQTFLECPAGGTDGDEPTEAAIRELREETGYRAKSAELLTSYYPSGWERAMRHVVYATDLTPGDPEPHDGEFLNVRLLPTENALKRIRQEPSVGWSLTPLLLACEEGLL
jgi:ADP-ribose pyrophosphatase